MRLSKQYQNVIKNQFLSVFGQGELYLFGSRVDDNSRGGDIDLYLKVTDHTNLFSKKIRFLAKIKRELGEQKIDVVFNENPDRPIEKEAQKWGIEL